MGVHEERRGRIQTVCGIIEPEKLGPPLLREHVRWYVTRPGGRAHCGPGDEVEIRLDTPWEIDRRSILDFGNQQDRDRGGGARRARAAEGIRRIGRRRSRQTRTRARFRRSAAALGGAPPGRVAGAPRARHHARHPLVGGDERGDRRRPATRRAARGPGFFHAVTVNAMTPGPLLGRIMAAWMRTGQAPPGTGFFTPERFG